ncbi:MFS transporter [Leucobacter sp. GX24907]
MTSNTPAERPHTPLRRIAIGCTAGAALELYDITLYGLAAGLVFNQLFFPSDDAQVATILALGSFGVGFIARPLGGLIFSHFGDRVGRKRMLQITLIVMGTATIAMGLLPTYNSVGLIAPVLLLLLRITQGIAQGGETGGALLTAVEHGPKGKRGLYGGVGMAGAPAGGVLGPLVFYGVLISMNDENFMAWGWRIPFLASAVIVLVGIYMRLQLEESPDFEASKLNEKLHRAPLFSALKRDWKNILLFAGVNIGQIAIFYVLVSWSPGYMGQTLDIDSRIAILAVMVNNIFQTIFSVIAGAIADRIRPWKVSATGYILALLWAYPFFLLLSSGSTALVFLAFIVVGIILGVVLGPIAAVAFESFPTEYRYSGFSIGYQFGAAIGGAVFPVGAATLVGVFGQTFWPLALGMGIVALLSALCLFGMKRYVSIRDFDLDDHAAPDTPPELSSPLSHSRSL